MNNIRAISFDLDDTLYDNKPVIKKAFQVLYNYLVHRYPKISSCYNFDAFLKAAILKYKQPLTTNINELRRRHIQEVLKNSGYQPDMEGEAVMIEQAFQVFWQARQNVELFPDTIRVLKKLSARYPLIAISNGNACIKSIGIDKYFFCAISAFDTGKPKPDSSMFLLACEKLAIKPEQLLHVGDDLENDIAGAYNAGCRSVWFNPCRLTEANHRVDRVIYTLTDLLKIAFEGI